MQNEEVVIFFHRLVYIIQRHHEKIGGYHGE